MKFALPVAALIYVANLTLYPAPPSEPDGWQSVSTDIDYSSGVTSSQAAFKMLQVVKAEAQQSEARILVLPEGAAGWRTPTSERAWVKLAAQTDTAFIAGFEENRGTSYDNAAALITADGFTPLYRQRMPVPISMWRPWSSSGTRAYWFAKPIVNVDNQTAAILVCYEQLLIWPILQSAIHDPDVIIGIANDWWAADTNIPDIQSAVLFSWARLFDIKLAEGMNL